MSNRRQPQPTIPQPVEELRSLLATALASAAWERDQPETVASLLANRLDVIERLAASQMVASAYTLRAPRHSAPGSTSAPTR